MSIYSPILFLFFSFTVPFLLYFIIFLLSLGQDKILDEIIRKQLIWYSHVERMDPTRLLKLMINWEPEGRKKRGRPQRTWKDGICTAVSERDLKIGEWNIRTQWNMEVGRRRQPISRLCIFFTYRLTHFHFVSFFLISNTFFPSCYFVLFLCFSYLSCFLMIFFSSFLLPLL